jgi:Arc/MetJ-type ribon-helix-helix transcriptional regulator
MVRKRVVKGYARIVKVRVGKRSLTLRVPEKIDDALVELVEEGYFYSVSEAVRFAILYLYTRLRELEEEGGAGG